METESVQRFIADGFVKIEQAVPVDVAEACAALLWAQIDAEPDDPSTWTQPVHVHSTARVLLMLFLFTEVDERNAPTRIRVGSHMDIPPVLLPYGDDGVLMPRIGSDLDAASAHRPVALATGRPGDVYLCHPFLVHAAQPHHGDKPRFMAQPPLMPGAGHLDRPFALNVTDRRSSPVGHTIRQALGVEPAARESS